MTLAESGMTLAESGVTLAESGVTLAESGMTLVESGVTLAESGVTVACNRPSCWQIPVCSRPPDSGHGGVPELQPTRELSIS
jgi:hypothetical protein